MADGFADEAAVLAVLAAVGAAVWYVLQGSFGSAQALLEDAEARGESIYERVQEVSANGELVVDPISGVFSDDPEQGSMNDEAGDDRNVSFASANELLADVGEAIDPRRYLPDVEGDTLAPSTGVLPDAGESQNFGDAPEAENDDLTERTANSNMSDEQKARWDRFANQDSTSDSGTSDSGTSTSTDDLGGISSGSSYDRFDSGGSSSSSSDDDDGGYTISLPDSITQDESEETFGDYSGGHVV